MLRPRVSPYRLILAGTALAAAAIVLGCAGAVRWLLLSLLFTSAGLWVGLGVAFPQFQMFGRSLCRVQTTNKAVALTFDDGPDPETTPALLELLARHRIHVTFFCPGKRLEQYPELARRIVAEGHAIENHSFEHNPWTNFFSVGRLRADVAKAQSVIHSITGRTPVFFRPPMGLTNGRVFRVAAELGLTVTGYTAHGLDRRSHPPERIVARVLRGVRPGAILLLHDSGPPTARTLAVVQTLINQLENDGYRCLRLDELLGVKP